MMKAASAHCPPLSALPKDPWFWSALLAGVLFWLGYYFLLPHSGMLDGQSGIGGISPARLLLLVMVFPVLEEAAFRGWLQGRLLTLPQLRRSVWHLSLANALTSLLFVALHAVYHPPGWALAVFFPSLVFGFFRERYDSIIPGIALHCFYNSGYYILLAL